MITIKQANEIKSGLFYITGMEIPGGYDGVEMFNNKPYLRVREVSTGKIGGYLSLEDLFLKYEQTQHEKWKDKRGW